MTDFNNSTQDKEEVMSTATSVTAMESERRLADYDSDEDDGSNHKPTKVSFRSIEIHEHSYILGDNPSVSGGAPLTISWQKLGSTEMDVDAYEFERSFRKDKSQLRLSNSDRACLLLQSGYSMEDIVRRSLEVNEDRDLRAESRRNQKWDGINHAIEKTTSKLKKVVRRSSMLATTPFRKTSDTLSATATKVMKAPRRHSVTGDNSSTSSSVAMIAAAATATRGEMANPVGMPARSA